MPPLLCPSPIILDHTFPRSQDELKLAAVALGSLMETVSENKAYMILTDTLRNFVEELDWTTQHMPLLVDVYRFLSQLFLQSHPNLRMVNLDGAKSDKPHPIPRNASEGGRVASWADELGKLLLIHDSCIAKSGYFIGIACERAFAGHAVNIYANKEPAQRAFPLVGPNEINSLEDCYEWEIPPSASGITISFENVKHNFETIGGIAFENPTSGGSHYKLKFPDGKCWICDKNWGRDIGDNVLKQLKAYCPYPLSVIKVALSSGALPMKRFRLPM